MTTTEPVYLDWITMETFDVSTLTGTYQAMNTGFSDDIKMLKVVNDSNRVITISKNGTDDNDVILEGQSWVYDIQANHATNSSYSSGTKYGRKGQILYGKGSTGGSGTLYIVGTR